jgi:hypothetical protein
MWFEKLMGFAETSHENVQNKIRVKGNELISNINKRSYQFGELNVWELREITTSLIFDHYPETLKVSQIVEDVQQLHCEVENNGALFQVASQFNLLEMAGPNKTPEDGVDIYSYDYTQGPACAIACGAGTIYRNYFAPVNGKIGQTKDNQINCLELIEDDLNFSGKPWEIINGYALLTLNNLNYINQELNILDSSGLELLKNKLKVGIQWDTQVTIADQFQTVTQVYSSALPVSYSHVESVYWEKFAKLILEATYEATLYAAIMNSEKTGNNKVFLTLIGGGAFGNDIRWILDSLLLTLKKFRNYPLDVKIVSHERPNPMVDNMIEKIWE